MVFPAALAVLAAPACSGLPSSASEDGPPKALTTFTVLADMARNVAGDEIEVESLTRPGAEIHSYEPTPDDLVRGQDADLILDNGLGLEAWFAQFTERIDAPTATLSDGVETIPISSGDYEGQANPHAWMSPRNARIYTDNIRDALSDLDPANAETYEANAEEYKAEIAEIGEFLDTELGSFPATSAPWLPARVRSPTSHATPNCRRATSGRSTPTARGPRGRSPPSWNSSRTTTYRRCSARAR